jgi:hypothetical protein
MSDRTSRGGIAERAKGLLKQNLVAQRQLHSDVTLTTSDYPKETRMKLVLIGAALAAAAAFATPALAQAVIEDPGYCAQFYPNANCQNLGPGNPYTDGGYYRGRQDGFATMPNHAARLTRPDRYADPDRYHGGPKGDE